MANTCLNIFTGTVFAASESFVFNYFWLFPVECTDGSVTSVVKYCLSVSYRSIWWTVAVMRGASLTSPSEHSQASAGEVR